MIGFLAPGKTILVPAAPVVAHMKRRAIMWQMLPQKRSLAPRIFGLLGILCTVLEQGPHSFLACLEPTTPAEGLGFGIGGLDCRSGCLGKKGSCSKNG